MKTLLIGLMFIVALSNSCWGQEWFLTNYTVGKNNASTAVTSSPSVASFKVSGTSDTGTPPVFHVEYLFLLSTPLELTEKTFLKGIFALDPESDSTVVWWGIVCDSGQSRIYMGMTAKHLLKGEVNDSIVILPEIRAFNVKSIEGVILAVSVYPSGKNVNILKNISMKNFYLGDSNITGIEKNAQGPVAFELSQNYPNPFNPTTTIRFSLPAGENVKIKIFDILGRMVSELFRGYASAGNHEIRFDGSKLSSGVYFYQLEAGKEIKTGKMILQK